MIQKVSCSVDIIYGFLFGISICIFVYITSCIAQLEEISGLFHKILRDKSLHKTAKESLCAREPKPIMF